MEKVKSRPTNEWLVTQEVLMVAIGFNEDDLDANRGGYMSKKQRAMLSRDRKDWLNNISILVVAIAGLYVLMLLGAIVAGGEFGNSVMLFGLVSVVVGGFCLYMAYMRAKLNADLHKGDIVLAEGILSLQQEINKEGQVVAHHASIQNQHFKISRTVYAAFKDGEPYAIYYTPFSKIILSAEWLRKRES